LPYRRASCLILIIPHAILPTSLQTLDWTNAYHVSTLRSCYPSGRRLLAQATHLTDCPFPVRSGFIGASHHLPTWCPLPGRPSVSTRVTALDLPRPRSATSRQPPVTLPGLRSRTRFSSLSSLPPIPSTPTMSWQWQGVSHSSASPSRRVASSLTSCSKPPTRLPQMTNSPLALTPVMPPRPNTRRSGTTLNTTPLRPFIDPPSP
jgi:hypothetical protein